MSSAFSVKPLTGRQRDAGGGGRWALVAGAAQRGRAEPLGKPGPPRPARGDPTALVVCPVSRLFYRWLEPPASPKTSRPAGWPGNEPGAQSTDAVLRAPRGDAVLRLFMKSLCPWREPRVGLGRSRSFLARRPTLAHGGQGPGPAGCGPRPRPGDVLSLLRAVPCHR